MPYSIGEFARLCGINATTLRAWQRRYGLLKPLRTDGGHRLYSDDDVQQALLAPDVVALRGDWSRPSDTISQFLTTRGSAAVPFNQIYGPGLPQGEILPALLDREHLLATLSAAKGK